MKKSTDFHVRISDDELELIDEKARQLRMTRSKYVIQSALHQKIITLDNTAIKQLTSELRKIGINVNHAALGGAGSPQGQAGRVGGKRQTAGQLSHQISRQFMLSAPVSHMEHTNVTQRAHRYYTWVNRCCT